MYYNEKVSNYDFSIDDADEAVLYMLQYLNDTATFHATLADRKWEFSIREVFMNSYNVSCFVLSVRFNDMSCFIDIKQTEWESSDWRKCGYSRCLVGALLATLAEPPMV